MNFWKRINALGSLALVALMTLALAVTLLPHLFGLKIAVIRDDAMQSTYPNGSLIFVRQQPATEINVGEIITYYLNQGEEVITRRVVAKDSSKELFYTKGDKEKQGAVEAVTKRNLIGQPVFHLPYLGLIASESFVKAAQVLFWLVASGLTLYTGWRLGHQLRLQKKRASWLEE
ncbi:signal peptidase I [Enterococcus asini]|uniref:signal peptidase I n=1 Tax=Enterococcus asini TaxID=57732 RepID=UPI0028923B91|nr:signal peptidase I [Enterococcus asini]MDT2756395.1 signal peptidase I [Enterococcus asini]